jgi:hypothetical protein
VDDYVNIGNPASLNQAFSQLTIEAWVKFNGFTDSDQNYIVAKDSVSGRSWGLWAMGGSHRAGMIVFTSTGVFYNTNGPVLSTGVWYHLVGVFDGSSVKIYVNGILGDSIPASGTTNTNPSSINIGRRELSGHQSWINGLIDDVLIYNRALSEAEIKALYDATK